MSWLMALMVALMTTLGLHGKAAAARTLDIELEFQHAGGMVEPGELDAWLASPELAIEALYHPLRLIEGSTARRIRTMPLGSRLEPIGHTVTLRGAQLQRVGRALRFSLDEQPPVPPAYRLFSVSLRVPIAPGFGRPQPVLVIGFLHEPAATGAHQAAFSGDFDSIDLGGRLRYRWSDATSDWQRHPPMCGGDIREVDAERYRFRVRHRHLGYFRSLLAEVSSDPPANPPAGWKSLEMRQPYPAPIAGWRVTRNHLIRLDVPGGRIERLSIYAEQPGPGTCMRTRAYEALVSGGQFVRIERSIDEYGCGNSNPPGRTTHAEWGADGRLASFLDGREANPPVYDAFSIGQPAACGLVAPPPDPVDVKALQSEVGRLREAFLQP